MSFKHEISPVYDKESRVLILGSFPSPKSRERGFYYGHPQNRMWKVLARVFGEDEPQTIKAKKEFLKRNHIAMWDVLAECDITGAADTSIKNPKPNNLGNVFKTSNIAAVFTTGAKAASLYEKFNGKKYDARHYQLLSTSPANAAVSFEELVADYIKVRLFEGSEDEYHNFSAKLIPNIDEDSIVGVRVPKVRAIAKCFNKDEEIKKAFLKKLPHSFHEENQIHLCFIDTIKDYKKSIDELERFMPYITNWAVCDQLTPKIFIKHLDEVEAKCKEWLEYKDIYTKRFSMGILMNLFLDDKFNPKHLKWVASVNKSDDEDYYLKMMIAWYFATALAKQWDETIKYIESKKLTPWVRNKSVQKALESFRITDKQKQYLRELRLLWKN